MSELTRPLVLCTDLDRTLIPNGGQAASPLAYALIARLVNEAQVTLVYVTGRDRVLVEQAINEFDLPQPDFVIGDVGSTICKITNGNWQPIQQWQQKLSADWPEDGCRKILHLMKGIDGLEAQEQGKQGQFKASFYVHDINNKNNVINEITTRLETLEAACSIVWSINEVTSTGLIDILPASANKQKAIEFLYRHLNVDSNDVIFAGDSGNDIDVMASHLQSILVANATVEVRRHAIEQAETNQQSGSLYLAKGDYIGLNGNYAAGILEGVAYYRPDIDGLIKDYLAET